MIGAFFQLSGRLILLLVYGKNNPKMPQGPTISLLLSIAFIFWFLCLLFLFTGTAEKDFWICIIYGIIFVVGIIIWAIIARTKSKKI